MLISIFIYNFAAKTNQKYIEMRIILIQLTLIIIGAHAVQLNAHSQCRITHYDEFSGMAQWYVTQIIQDKQGMMWFATWNGLNRYDGYEFQCFKSRTGDGVDIPSDRISDIKVMSDGSLRCYIEGRVFGFCTKNYIFFEIPATEEKQLKAYFDRKHIRDVVFEREGPPNHYKDVYGTEWTISQKGKLMYKNSVTGIYEEYPSDWHGAKRIRLCTADNEGNIWLTSDYGTFKLSFHQKPYSFFEQEKPVQVRALFLDSKQRYWITTRDDATVRIYGSDNRLLGYLGSDGRIHHKYTAFKSPIYHIMQDSKGTYWLCSKPGGLFRLRETDAGIFSVEQFKHIDGNIYSLTDNDIYHAVEDSHGRLWIATFNGGVNCITDPQAALPVFHNQYNGMEYPKTTGQRVRQFHISRQDILLIATTSGLFIADISPKDIRQIRFKQHKKDVNRSNSLSNNATMYISEDSKHRIYVCTESGGVNQILSDNLKHDQIEFRHFNLSTGFPSDVALSAIPLGDDMLVVSNNQIIQLKQNGTDSGSYETFLWQDRLRFSDATPLKLPDGRWIVGLQNGALTLKAEEIRKSSFIPPIVLTKLSIENSQSDYTVNKTDTLILNPAQRNIFLQFSALDYMAEGDIDYAFRLGCHDEPWNNIGKDHSVTLLDLSPGTYQLQIRSTNSDGVWVDNVRTLNIIVTPAFYETVWAKLLYALLALFIAWGIIRTRKHIINLNSRQHELHEAYLALLNANNTTQIPEHKVKNQEPQTSKPKIKPEDEAFMQRAMKFIEEHLGDANINIGDMAEATATSRSGLNRKMKSLLGVTPLDFIREARIRKACQMLKEGSPINDVAYSCGFSDPKYFGKCFKAEMGITPTEYKVENSAK